MMTKESRLPTKKTFHGGNKKIVCCFLITHLVWFKAFGSKHIQRSDRHYVIIGLHVIFCTIDFLNEIWCNLLRKMVRVSPINEFFFLIIVEEIGICQNLQILWKFYVLSWKRMIISNHTKTCPLLQWSISCIIN